MDKVKVVVNGCFDLLHRGHIQLIHTALLHAQRGEVLVLLNSDQSIKELKGEKRPYEEVLTRGHEIEKVITRWCQKNLEYPKTYIQIFNTEEELATAIDKFEPDMIIKGDDRPDTRDIVGSGKWPILIVPRLADKDGNVISTTSIAKEKKAE